MNVHRIARNGRNAEYLSGEDPALGAPLTTAFIHAVQSMGVAAVVKHFVLNSQETNRGWQSSDASDRALYEVYYPPFKAAVDAGVASIMCGYNQARVTSNMCGYNLWETVTSSDHHALLTPSLPLGVSILICAGERIVCLRWRRARRRARGHLSPARTNGLSRVCNDRLVRRRGQTIQGRMI